MLFQYESSRDFKWFLSQELLIQYLLYPERFIFRDFTIFKGHSFDIEYMSLVSVLTLKQDSVEN